MNMKHAALSFAIAAFGLTGIAKAEDQTGDAPAAAAPLNCTTLPGSSLCRDIRIAQSYLVGCTGGCEGLLRDQTRALTRVANSYFDVLLPGMKADNDIAMQAYNTAVKICGYRWRDANVEAIGQWVIAANRALDGLKEVQVAGNLRTTKYCQMSSH